MEFNQSIQQLNSYFSKYPLTSLRLSRLSPPRAQIIGSTVQFVYSYETPGQSNDCLINSFLSSYIPVFKYLDDKVKGTYSTMLRRQVLVAFCKTVPRYSSKIPALQSSFPLSDDIMDVLVSYFSINIYAIKRPGPDAPPNIIIESTPASDKCVIINNIGNFHFETACISPVVLDTPTKPPDACFTITNSPKLISTPFLQDAYRPQLSPSFTEDEKKKLIQEETSRILKLEASLQFQLVSKQKELAAKASSQPNPLHALPPNTRVFFNNTTYRIVDNDKLNQKYIVSDTKLDSDMPYYVVDAWAKLTDPSLRFRVL